MTRIQFEALPKNLDELKAMPEAAMTDPYAVAALGVAVLCRYEESPEDCLEMLRYLKGSQPISVYETQFLRDRLVKKGYVPRSYFEGTKPANDYTPNVPYAVNIEEGPYARTNYGYIKFTLYSSGADNQRYIVVRNKGDKWYLWENYLLPDIRIPASQDPWA